MLLRPFVRDGEIAIHYPCYGRRYTVFVRTSDMSSDLFTLRELLSGGVYPLPHAFSPDLIIDGGGNIGLFTLLASAAFPSARIVVCEPVPRSLAQIEKHLRLNGVSAELLPACLGGRRQTIPFYVREPIASSFDPRKPYTSTMGVEVVTLSDVLEAREARRILIKLDIEGMELEVLESFVPGEKRPVCVLGELHERRVNGRRLERIFDAAGWRLTFCDSSERDSIFEACSPMALSLMANENAIPCQAAV
jgi:FkbM family methyltransferase